MIVAEELLSLTGMTEQQLRQQLALWLYAKGKLSMGRAVKFAQVNRAEFMDLMAKNNVVLNYSIDDLESDMQTIQKLGL